MIGGNLQHLLIKIDRKDGGPEFQRPRFASGYLIEKPKRLIRVNLNFGWKRSHALFRRQFSNESGRLFSAANQRSSWRDGIAAFANENVPSRIISVAPRRKAPSAARASALPFPFTLTARCENYLHGRRDLADTIARLVAYRDAGADVLYAPGLTDPGEIAELTHAVDAPVNVVMGLQGVSLSVDALAALGVKRMSVGSALARAALGAFLRGATEMMRDGTFSFANAAIPSRQRVEAGHREQARGAGVPRIRQDERAGLRMQRAECMRVAGLKIRMGHRGLRRNGEAPAYARGVRRRYGVR